MTRRSEPIDASPITDEIASWYARNGVTPAMIERAYNEHTVRSLAGRLRVSEDEIRGLAVRWGVTRKR